MKKIATWFLLSCKRYARRLSFLAVLFLLPIGAMAVHQFQKTGNQGIDIAISVEGGGENRLGQRLMDSLVDRSLGADSGMFHFYACEDEAQARDDVASNRAECGYVIYEGLQEKLQAGKYKRSIGVISSPSTVTASLSTETVFAALMKLYDRKLLEDYVAKEEMFASLGNVGSEARGEAAAQAGSLYDKWLGNGSTFRFEYSFLGQEEAQKGGKEAEAEVFPVRGLVAVYVFVAGLYGAVVACQDSERGLFLPLAYGVRTPCKIASIAAPVAMTGAAGPLALWTGRTLGPLPGELAAMCLYCGFVSVVSWLLCLVCRKSQILCCTIPFFIIGSLVLCPVFVDAGRFFPVLEQVGRMFPPWHYLQFFMH